MLAGAAVVVLLLLFFPALLQDLPQPALAAIVIVAALSLFNIAILRTYFRMRKSALVTSLIASLGVILFGVLEGIMIAIVLSILLFFRRSWWPEGEVLGRVHELDGWHRTDRFPDAEEADGVIVYRWEAPLFFANAGIFRQEIRTLVHRRRPRWVVLQCEAITDIDVTAADMLDDLDKELNDEGHQRRVRRDAHPDRGSPRALRAVRHLHAGARLPLDRHGVARDRGGGPNDAGPSMPPRPPTSSTTRPRHSGSISR